MAPRTKRRKKRKSKSSTGAKVTYGSALSNKKKRAEKAPKRKKKIFKRKNKKSKPKTRKQRRALVIQNILKAFGILLLVSGLLAGAYFGVNAVIEMRNSTNSDAETPEGFIVGIQDIPVFPGSEFIYEGKENERSVQEFISSGRTVYRLPTMTSSNEVYEYYKEEMEKFDWEHTLSVGLTSETQEYGEYWTNSKYGVRIYTKLNDVWYEKISINEADTGLEARVSERTEREVVLKPSEGTELLPDFPWKLTVPKEYVVSYYSTSFSDMRGAQFRKIGSDEIVILEPIGDANQPYDISLERFISELNNGGNQSDLANSERINNEQWVVMNAAYTVAADRTALLSSITSGEYDANAYVIASLRSGYAYVITTLGTESELIDYILENIEDKNLDYVKEDFEF